MRRRSVSRWTALLSVVLVSACSSGGTTDPGGAITLNLSASNLSVVQGATGNLVATIGRTGDFAGNVTITIENLPDNVTASAEPASIPSGSSTSAITFTVGAGAAAASNTVRIRASGSGVTARTADVTLTVTASSTPGYGIGLNPASLSIQQGAQGQTAVTLTRTGGFTGNVQFSQTGAPNGMTVSFNPTQTTGNTAAVTVAVGAGVAAQTYQVTIRGEATGLAAVTTVLSVTVTTQGGGGGSTTFRVCNQTMLFAAYQDGTGPWTVATIDNGSSITFNLASPRGAVAYVFSNNANSYTVNYMYATQAELNAGTGICPQAPATKTIFGSVANIGADDIAAIALGTSSGSVLGGLGGPNFTLFQVPTIAVDLIATRNLFTNAGGALTQVSNKIIVRRNQNPAANAVLPVLDFNAAEAVTPVTRTLTVNNLGSEVLAVQVTFGSQLATAASTAVGIFSDIPGSNAGAYPHPAHPAAGANDMHGYSMLTAPVGGATRTLIAYYREGLNRTVTLGAHLGAVTVTTAATAPSARLRLQYTTQSDYNRGWATNYNQNAGGANRRYTVNVTAGYQGASPTLDHTLPDLSGLTGWNAIWGLVAGQQIQWDFTGTGGSATTIVDGSVVVTASRTGTVTP